MYQINKVIIISILQLIQKLYKATNQNISKSYWNHANAIITYKNNYIQVSHAQKYFISVNTLLVSCAYAQYISHDQHTKNSITIVTSTSWVEVKVNLYNGNDSAASILINILNK